MEKTGCIPRWRQNHRGDLIADGEMHMKKILQGNEAIARGAWEAGVTIAAAYPGTPSSEILKEVADNYPEIYAEWAPNEKVAVEVASGGSMAGARSMASMKHVGLNVASSDPSVFNRAIVSRGELLYLVKVPPIKIFPSD